MHYAMVDKEHAEMLRSELAKNRFLGKNADVLHSNSYVLFPVNNTTARRKRGSKRRERAKAKLQRKWMETTNRSNDFAHFQPCMRAFG